MACPFFMPGARYDSDLWQHRQRLPLGDGHAGRCMVPGREDAKPSETELKDFCNIGYASGCVHLPKERDADVVRFAIGRDGGRSLSLQWVTEREHLPVEHGALEYDADARHWSNAHPNVCIQRMAECYMETYIARHPRQRSAGQAE